MVNDGFFHYQLQAYRDLGVLVSLFIDPENPDDFIAGYVSRLNHRQVIVTAVSPVGRYDGLVGVRLSEIDTVMGEDDYALRLRRALQLRGSTPTDRLEADDNDDLFKALLRLALDQKRAVTVWSGDSEYAGFVEELDDMRVTLRALDFFGQNPEPATLALRDIGVISYGAEEELMLELLSANPPESDET